MKILLAAIAITLSMTGCTTYNTPPAPTATTTTYATPVVPAASRTSVSTTSTSY